MTGTKYRICIHCGHAIQKRKLYYLGKPIGEAYVHVRLGWKSLKAFQRFIDGTPAPAEPRPVPVKTGAGRD